MKYFRILYLIVFSNISLNGQIVNLCKYNLNGPIKEIIRLEYESEEAFNMNNFESMDSIAFNKVGNLIHHKLYNNKGDLLIEKNAKYNAAHDLIEYILNPMRY